MRQAQVPLLSVFMPNRREYEIRAISPSQFSLKDLSHCTKIVTTGDAVDPGASALELVVRQNSMGHLFGPLTRSESELVRPQAGIAAVVRCASRSLLVEPEMQFFPEFILLDDRERVGICVNDSINTLGLSSCRCQRFPRFVVRGYDRLLLDLI
jgi:hypothetical protein